jgi:hypothetical protein
MSDDVVQRAKTALEGVSEGPWEVEVDENGRPVGHYDDSEDNWDPEAWFDVDGSNGGWIAHVGESRDAAFCAASRQLVPELIAEIERLRAGGPWVEHVERMNAMKRERDGGCVCDGNPATTDGPQEDCPWHGREYRYWVDSCATLAAENERLRMAEVERQR